MVGSISQYIYFELVFTLQMDLAMYLSQDFELIDIEWTKKDLFGLNFERSLMSFVIYRRI